MEDNRAFFTRVAAGVIAIGIFVVSSLPEPLLVLDAVLRGALLVAGFGALGIQITGALAGARAAGRRLAKKR